MVTVVIDYGHVGEDSGAIGNGFREDFLNKSIGTHCVDELSKNGINVVVSTGSLLNRVTIANKVQAVLCVSIHDNAGGGDGTEVLYKSPFGKIAAQKILDSILSKNLNNSRGLKHRDDLYILNRTNMVACLVECAFMDTKDIQAVDTEEERKQFGIAIANGILNYLGIERKLENKTTVFYRVVTDSFIDKENAIDRVKELDSKYGINSFIAEYTK